MTTVKTPTLESSETTSGIERGLSFARRLAEQVAKGGMKPEDLAAELKRAEDSHQQWAASVSKYRQILAWYQQLTPTEQESKGGRRSQGRA